MITVNYIVVEESRIHHITRYKSVRFIDGQGFCIRDNKTSQEDLTVKYLVRALVTLEQILPGL